MDEEWRNGQLHPNDSLQARAQFKIIKYAYALVQKVFLWPLSLCLARFTSSSQDYSGFLQGHTMSAWGKRIGLVVSGSVIYIYIYILGTGPCFQSQQPILVRLLHLHVPSVVIFWCTVLPSHKQGQDQVHVVVVRVHPGMMRSVATVPMQQDADRVRTRFTW